MPSTRKVKRARRWLVRLNGVDYGPYDTDQVLEQIARRQLDLGTEIADASKQRWEPLGSHALFRDHYARCQEQWEVEDAEHAASRHEQQLHVIRHVKRGTWPLVIVGLVGVLAFGAWGTWRLLHAEPTGILDAVVLGTPTSLPSPPEPTAEAPSPPPVQPRRVEVLSEPRNYDTAGVKVGGEGAPAAMRLALGGDGDDARGLSEEEAERVANRAQRGLVDCAREAAGRSSDFEGTRVSFMISPRELEDFVVGREVAGNEAFQACVKKVLQRVDVPSFEGGGRRVTVPLEVQR